MTYIYAGERQRTNVTTPDGTVRSYDYDEAGRTTSVDNSSTTGGQHFGYAYDSNGNILSENTTRYSYDKLNRLKEWYAPSRDTTTTYSYDSVGNLLSVVEGTSTVKSFTYNVANQITNSGFAYDANGNMTSDDTYRFVYDAADRLVVITFWHGYLTYYYGYPSIHAMDMTNAIESVFGTTGRIKVLSALSNAPRPLTGRQVAELSGLTHRGAIQALAGLVEVCAVTQRQVGRAHQYELAEDNIVVEQIVLPALRAEETFFDQMRQALVDDFSPYTESLVLFGSLARGDHTARSDVDLLAVVDVEEAKAVVEEKVDSLAARFAVRFGRPLSVHVLNVSELRKRSQPAFLKEALREGLLLAGQSLEGLIERGA